MISALRKIALLVGKDLRVEARSRQTLGLVIMLGVLIIVVLGMGLGLGRKDAPAFGAAAVLWVAYLFGGALCFEKTMAIERQDGALTGLLAAPIGRGIVFAGKLVSNLLLMFILAVVVTPVAILLFGFDLSAAPGGFALVMALSMVGFAAVGTLFSAVTGSTRLPGGLLAVVAFVLCLPVVLTSTTMLIGLFEENGSFSLQGLGLILAFDAIFLVISWLAFEWVLEP